MKVKENAIYDGQECVAIMRNTRAADEIRKVFEKAASYDRIMAKANELPVAGISGSYDIKHNTKGDLSIEVDATRECKYIVQTKCKRRKALWNRQCDVDIKYMAAAANLALELVAEACVAEN